METGGILLPKISIVTPSFRARATIEDTIKSVLSQQYPNLEYIVMDGAGDDTARVLERYNDQLAYWCSEPDGGQYDAINKGFARATGDVLMWLNADDMLLPRSLFVVGEVFRDLPEVQWISTLKPGGWDANGYFAGMGVTAGYSREAFLDGYYLPGTRRHGRWIQQESTVFTRQLWTRAGGRMPRYDLAGDFALWAEFYRHAELFGVEYPIAGFRSLAGQRSADAASYRKEASAALGDCRKALDWQGSRYFDLRYSRLLRFPKVDRALRHRIGYPARTIGNIDPYRPGAGWRIREHRFLPQDG